MLRHSLSLRETITSKIIKIWNCIKYNLIQISIQFYRKMCLKMMAAKQCPCLFYPQCVKCDFCYAFYTIFIPYLHMHRHCPACRTYEITTRFWVVVICPIIKCLTVLEFSFILFDLCLFITIFNFILNYVLIVTFWIFTYHKIWILLIIYCLIWNYWIIYFLTCLEVFWCVVS